MTTFAPRRQLPIAAGQGAPLRIPFTSTAPASAPSPIAAPDATVAAPARGRLAQLLAGLRRTPAAGLTTTTAAAPIARAHDAVYRDDDGGWGDDGGWD